MSGKHPKTKRPRLMSSEESEDIDTTSGTDEDVPTDEDSVGSLAEFIDDGDECLDPEDDDFEPDKEPDPGSEPSDSEESGSDTPDVDEGIDTTIIIPPTQKRQRRPPVRYQPKNLSKLMLADVPDDELSEVMKTDSENSDSDDDFQDEE